MNVCAVMLTKFMFVHPDIRRTASLRRGAAAGILVTLVGFLTFGYYTSKCGMKDACTMPLVVGAVLAALCIVLLFVPGPWQSFAWKGIVSVGMKDSSGGLATTMKYFTFIPSGVPCFMLRAVRLGF
eukprot:SAG31_NODE_656_length_13120_cov_10.091237_2_plen_126_part_00